MVPLSEGLPPELPSSLPTSPTGGSPRPRAPECPFYDVAEVAHLSKALMFALATASVEKVAGYPFHQAASVVGDVKKEMLAHLSKATEVYAAEPTQGDSEAGFEAYRVVVGMLEKFLEGKRSMFTKFSSKIMYGDKKDEHVDALIAEIERAGVWVKGRRDVLSQALIKRVDKLRSAHCGAIFEDDGELEEHMRGCQFRPQGCEHRGCAQIFSARRAAEHDARCPRKPLECEQGCEELVPREEMQGHCATVCPMRVVACPFQRLGCDEALKQGEVKEHCREAMDSHLLMVGQGLEAQQAEATTQSHRLGLLEQNVALVQKSSEIDSRELAVQLQQANSKVKELEGHVKAMQQALKGANAAHDIQQLRLELKALKGKLAAEHG
eukprot:jgi/Mesen1/5061/ME000252S04169